MKVGGGHGPGRHRAGSARSRRATSTAMPASRAQPSARMSAANSSEIGAPPTMIRTGTPVARTAAVASRMDRMVVVSSADMPTMSGRCSMVASANVSAATSTPRSITAMSAPFHMAATRSLPMSWMSPCTVPITTVPLVVAASPAVRCGFSRAAMPFMISPPMMSSGMKASPFANLSPMMSMAALASSRMATASAPSASRLSTSARASASRKSTMAWVSSCVTVPPCGLRPRRALPPAPRPCTGPRGAGRRAVHRGFRRVRSYPSRARTRGRPVKDRAPRSAR